VRAHFKEILEKQSQRQQQLNMQKQEILKLQAELAEIKKASVITAPVQQPSLFSFSASMLWGGTKAVAEFAFVLGREVGSYLLVQMLVGACLKQVGHDDTIGWYVHYNACYPETVQIAQEYIKKIKEESSNDKNQAGYSASLQQACDDLVTDIEKLLAFMEHKAQRLSAANAHKARIKADFIFHYVNEWITNINGLLTAETMDCEQVSNRIEQLKKDIDLEVKHFKKIEKGVVVGRLLEIVD
jgi:hypothetical protein